MTLDISSLRLTDEEIDGYWSEAGLNGSGIADAQLAKALWGVQEWLETLRYKYLPIENAEQLRNWLLAAGMPRPEGD